MVTCDHGKNSSFYSLKIKYESKKKGMTKIKLNSSFCATAHLKSRQSES